MKSKIFTLCAAIFFTVALPAHASTTVNINNGQLNFGADTGTDQTSTIGAGAGLGFTHRYSNIFSGVDGILTVTDVVNIDRDDNASTGVDNLFDTVDDTDSTSGKDININIDIAGEAPNNNQTGSATLRVDFVQAGTNTPVTLQNISINVKDIDGKQFVRFSGINAYELSATPTTNITATNSSGVYEFAETGNIGSSSTDQDHWALVEYASADSVTFTVGATKSGGAFFGVSFVDATWSSAAARTTPALTAFNLSYDGNSADSGTSPATQSSTSSSSVVTLSAPQGDLVKANCTFNGWNTRTDGTGANYVSGNTITLTSNVTLYANWSCVSGQSSSGNAQVVSTQAQPQLANTGATETMALTALVLVVLGGLSVVYSRKALRK